jgi:2-amino-4-hydroxy-6-hydroxymethyldihydropteridine diphosphokinase
MGTPRQTLEWVIGALAEQRVYVVAQSRLYVSRAVGLGGAPDFLNAVAAIDTSLSPAMLLRLFKALERRAGRRFCRASGPRPLDLDIIDYRGWVLGRPHRRRIRGSLILPHPEAANRRFVLEPLAEVAPHWRHPRTGQAVGQRLTRLLRAPRSLRPALDFVPDPCQ